MSTQPTVSVIISAYNRPKVITYAIESVLGSDYEDWEMIVVGDGCNKETEESIKAFSDPRIRFFNLPENTGHQSAPHNKGVEMARGTYVFFLNQDDMYFPDHISTRVEFMQKTGAEISWAPILLLKHSAMKTGSVDPDKDGLILDGAVADGNFHPNSFIISSCWSVRREICSAVGPWLPIAQTRLSPSQEWLHRASHQNRKMVYHRNVSVLCIHSGVRPYSYLNSESPEHQRAWDWIKAGQKERIQLINSAAVQMAGHLFEAQNALERHRRPFLSLVQKIARKIGLHPDSVQRFFSGMKKGAWVNNHTKITKGAPPELSPEHVISFEDGSAEDMIGRGWYESERTGRWSSLEMAEIMFSTKENDQVLAVTGHALRKGESIEFLVNGQSVLSQSHERDNQVFAVPIVASGTNVLTIFVKNPTSPKELGLSGDDRVLGFHLNSIKLRVSFSTVLN